MTIVVIVLGAVVTGSISLVLEDLLPKSDPAEVIVAPRWILLVSSVLLVGFAVWLRFEVRSFSGTLFSVQVLDEGVADRPGEGGTAPRPAASRRYMYLRFIHRIVDFEHSVRAGVLELHALCHEIGMTLESLMNTAQDEGTQTIAPNMPWPMAMAIGTYLPARQVDVRLLELPTRHGDAEHEFALHYALEARTASCARRVRWLPDAHGERTGVLLGSTHEADPNVLDRFRSFGVAMVYVVTASPGGGPDDSARYVDPELESLGRVLAEELVRIKEHHRDGELVVAATLPTAVALSMGWHLTQYTCRFYRGTHLLYFDGAGFVPMRVRPAQPAFSPRSED